MSAKYTDAEAVAAVDTAGYVAGAHTTDTDTVLNQAAIETMGFVTGAHTIAAGSPLDPYVTVDPNPINGLAGPHIIFTGANIHVRNGSGSTEGAVNGKGNLIVGYNEYSIENRTGSHNMVVGPYHTYSSYGGLVAGFDNKITGDNASVSGGFQASVSGTYNWRAGRPRWGAIHHTGTFFAYE